MREEGKGEGAGKKGGEEKQRRRNLCKIVFWGTGWYRHHLHINP